MLQSLHISNLLRSKSLFILFFLLIISNTRANHLVRISPMDVFSKPRDTIQANIFLDKANIFADSAFYDSAITYYRKASEIYLKTKIWDKYIECQNGIFIVSRSKGYDENLMALARDKLKIAEKKLGKSHIYYGTCITHIGNIFDDMDKKDSALIFFKMAIEAWEISAGKKSTEVANGYVNIAIAYNSAGEDDSTLKYANLAIDLYDEIEGSEYIGLARVYNTLGVMAYHNGDFDGSANYMMKSLEVKRKYYGEDHPAISDSYNNLGAVYASRREFEKALEYYYKSLEIRLAKLDALNPNIALSYNNIANTYDKLGRYRKSEEYHLKALELRKKIWGDNHTDIAMSYTNLGILKMNTGYFDEAFTYFEKARDIQEFLCGYYHIKVSDCYNNMGAIYMEKGEIDSAIVNFKRALDIREKLGRNQLAIAGSYNNLGVVYKNKGNFDLALAYYQKCLSITESVLGKEHFNTAGSYNNIGEIYLLKGDYEQALCYFEKKLHIVKEVLGDHHPEIAGSYLNMGTAYNGMHKYAMEVRCYEEGINCMLNSESEMHPILPSLYTNLALCYNDSGKTSEAISLIKKAIHLEEIIYGGKHPELASTYRDLAEIFLNRNEYDSAGFYLQKSMIALESNFAPNETDPLIKTMDELEYLKSQISIADMYYEEYKNEKNLKVALQAINAFNNISETANKIRQLYNLEDSKMTFLKEISDVYPKAIDVAINVYNNNTTNINLNTVYRFIEESKSLALLDAVRQSEISSCGNIPDTIISKEKRLKNELSVLKTQILLNESEDFDSILYIKQIDDYNSTRIGYEELMDEIKQNYPSYRQLICQDIYSLDDIMTLIDNNTAMLQYVLGDSQIIIFIIRNEGCDIIRKVTEGDLSEIIKNYLRGITRNRKADYFKYNPVLFTTLIQPVLPYLKNKQKIIIIPDKELLYLPFESLSYFDDNAENFEELHYLVNDFEITYQYSSSLWYLSKQKFIANKDAENAFKGGFIGYAPVFASKNKDVNNFLSRDQYRDDSTYRNVRIGDRYFGDLPYAETEVKSIINLFKEKGLEANGRFFEDANEISFCSETKDYKYIHVATHGLINDEHPELSGLLFYLSDTTKLQSEIDSLDESNITYSMDGILHTKEVYNLNLNADLIVLSACETGCGLLLAGEGVMSLTRGFIYAGAPNVIFSFWKVGDKSTSDLMYKFYSLVLEGESYSKALRAAKLELIRDEKTSYPGIWSGFSLIGY